MRRLWENSVAQQVYKTQTELQTTLILKSHTATVDVDFPLTLRCGERHAGIVVVMAGCFEEESIVDSSDDAETSVQSASESQCES